MSAWYRCRCGERWQVETLPEVGERMDCPRCGERASRERAAAELLSERYVEPARPPRAARAANSRTEVLRGNLSAESTGRKPFLVLTLLGCTLLVIAAIFLWRAYDKTRTRVEYYRDWTWKLGRPHGIDRIDQFQLSAEGFGVRFTYKGALVEKIEYLSGSQAPMQRYTPESIAFDNEPYWCQPSESRFELSYAADHSIASQDVFDREGAFLYRVRHDSATRWRYCQRDDQPYFAPWLGSSAVQYEWSPLGFHERIVPELDRPEPADDTTRRFTQIRCAYDARGLLLAEEYQDAAGKPVKRFPRGYAGYRAEYSPDLAVTQFTALDEEGRPQRTFLHFATVKIRYDHAAGQTITTYLDELGAPVRCQAGYARRQRRFDRWGHITNEAYFDEHESPHLHRDGYASFDASNDSRGNAISLEYLGVNGERVMIAEGYHLLRREFDYKNRVTREIYFDTKMERVLAAGGFAERRNSYDEYDYNNGESFYGADGKRIAVGGRARWEARHDAHGRILQIKFFGTDDRPVVMADGFASWTATYTASGRPLETRYFGTDGKPIRLREGHAVIRRSYDDKDNLSTQAYFDDRDQPCAGPDGVARSTWRSDDKGRTTEAAHFGTDGKPIVSKQGYARVTYRYDPQRTETAYFGADGKPIMANGCARSVTIRNDRRTEQAFYDTVGNLVNQSDGVARWISTLDKNYLEVERLHFDAHGKPALNRDGWFRVSRTATADGRQHEEQYFDRSGQLVPIRYGYARRVWHYDGDKPLRSEFFDSQGRRLPSMVVVEFVEDDTEAAKSGIKPGDLLLQYNGTNVATAQALSQLLEKESAGSTARSIVVRRGLETVKLQIPPACFDIQWDDQPLVELVPNPRAAH